MESSDVMLGAEALGTTVHILIAAAEDDEGDRIKNIDAWLSLTPIPLAVSPVIFMIVPIGVVEPSESILLMLNSGLAYEETLADVACMTDNNDFNYLPFMGFNVHVILWHN